MKWYAPAAALLILCAGAAFLWIDSYQSSTAMEAFRNEIASYPQNRNIPERVYEKYYDSLGAEAMIRVIDERKACHLEGHNLGRLMYQRTKNLPLGVTQCGSMCYNGCSDGVLIGFVEGEREDTGVTGDPQPEDLTPRLIKKIMSLCESGEVLRSIGPGGCYHALGHVFAYFTDSDIKQTLTLCRMLEKFGDGAIFHCAAGMYMQRSGDYSEADIAATPSRLYPCDTEDYPAACFRYRIPILYGSTTPLTKIAHDCDLLREPDKAACFHALGVTYFRRSYDEPQAINWMCASSDTLARRMCLDGVLGRLLTYDIDGGERICSAIQGMTKSECLESSVSLYSQTRDYSSYLVTRP